jgi:hypothetical protein
MNKKVSSITVFLVFLLSMSLFPSEGGGDENIKKEESENTLKVIPDINYWGMNADVHITGIDLLDRMGSSLLLSGGAGIRSLGYYRDENDDYYEADDETYDVYEDLKNLRIHTNWGAGLTQGFIKNPQNNGDLLYGVLKYRGIREWNVEDDSRNQILFNSIRNDKDGILVNSLITALIFDSTVENRASGNKKGIKSEISLERAPEWFFNDIVGKSDFIKYYGSFSFFLPLVDFSNKTGTAVSGLYLADYAAADYVSGDYIPLIARQKIGSLNPSNGLGGRIRGFETRRFDGELKVANNLELRMNLPVINFTGGESYFRPGALLFLDSGYYDLLSGTDADTIISCGGGMTGDISGFIRGMTYISFPLKGERLDKETMVISFDVGFHF